MKLYKTRKGIIVTYKNIHYQLIENNWDDLVNRTNLHKHIVELKEAAIVLSEAEMEDVLNSDLLAPIGSQEVWAAGVTYMRSKVARMEESQESGGADFYDKVYDADRPELFFKSMPHRVCGHNTEVYIRQDSSWNVPEPELTLFINANGDIAGYTIGNDVSSRSIEGENPLYLPQAKVYEKSAAMGPCLFIPEGPIDKDAIISIVIKRDEKEMYNDTASINKMKRSHAELTSYLLAGFDFPQGAYLMTGTCLVPGNDFTLQPGDVVSISIEGIGTLVNTVAFKPS
jgi:2-dehydro-3-deoxy-D-arabinonate dehydratase